MDQKYCLQECWTISIEKMSVNLFNFSDRDDLDGVALGVDPFQVVF
jgi:hypothetical protein